MLNYLPFAIILLILSIGLLKKFNRDEPFINKNDKYQLSISNLIFLLIPLTPIVQYLLYNSDILNLYEAVVVFSFFTIFSSLFIIIIPYFISRYSSSRVTMSLGLAFIYLIFNMASISQNFNWFGEGSLKIQLLFLGFSFLLSWLVLGINDKKTLVLIIVGFLGINIVSTVQSNSVFENDELIASEETKLELYIKGQSPQRTPNIYLLVYDSYVTNETMLNYGIDNSSQEEYLKILGFTLYPRTYSIDGATVESMSRVLNASTDFLGPRRRALSGDGVVQNSLQNIEYKVYGIFPSDYWFRGIGSSYDSSFYELSIDNIGMRPHELLISGILTGEFRFDIGFDDIPYNQFIETKRDILSKSAGNQVFIYTHSKFPNHSQNSGTCLSNEKEKYSENLNKANDEMIRDINTIIDNDPDSIIIVAGDHGPYLTKNCIGTSDNYDISEITREDIQDRFGTFLAIRWPTEDHILYDDINVLQDLFVAIFAYMYEDLEILQFKIPPEILGTSRISGASVNDGIIIGGINDGEPLFLGGE